MKGLLSQRNINDIVIFSEKTLLFSEKIINNKLMQSIEKKILSKIYGHAKGWSFTANDFSRDFKRDNVDKALSTLLEKDKIKRATRGVYYFPKYSELLKQELSPDIDQVAQAIARKFNWRIQASGDAALNLLGLSTQVPSKYTYLSDGPDRSYQIGKTTLTFKKSVLKDIGFKHKESGLIVHALKALGKDRIDNNIIDKIRNQIDSKKHKKIMEDTKTVTSWVYETIRKICDGSS